MKAAYIGRIYIENFHAFQGKNEIPIIKEDGTLQQWTVIVGENNSGKTSLLKAVAELEPMRGNLVPPNGEKSPTFVSPKNFLLTSKDEKFYILCDVFFKTNEVKKYEVQNSINGGWGYSYGNWSFDTDNGELMNLKIDGYGVSRKINNNDNSSNKRLLLNNAITLIYDNQYLTDTTDWLFQLNFASKNSEDKTVQNKATDRIKHIKNLIISEIFPDIFDLRFTTTDDLKNHLEFQTKDGWFQLHELGYGYQTTLAWIFDLSKKMMERYPESEQPLREPAVVLIDEIDLHLHPAWQRRIINYLSDNFTATQFIVTTHSPHVLQELKEVNLVQLKRENGATKIICRPNSSFQGWTIEEILNDVLETRSTHSTRYEELMQKFDQALDNEDFKTAHETYETLSKILHPSSPDRKILEIQLSQLTA